MDEDEKQGQEQQEQQGGDLEAAVAALDTEEGSEQPEAKPDVPPSDERDKPPPAEVEEPKPAFVTPPDELIGKLTAADKELRELRSKVKQFQEAGGGLAAHATTARQDVPGTLKQLGISLDDVLNAYAGDDSAYQEAEPPAGQDQQQTPPAYLKEIKGLKEQLGAMQQQLQQQAVFREVDRVATVARQGEGERWELVQAMGEPAYQMAINTAYQIQQHEGRIPPYAEVLDLVEKFYEDQEKQRIGALAKTKKLGALFAAERKAAAEAAAAPAGNGKSAPAVAPREADTPANREESDDEIMARALKELGG